MKMVERTILMGNTDVAYRAWQAWVQAGRPKRSRIVTALSGMKCQRIAPPTRLSIHQKKLQQMIRRIELEKLSLIGDGMRARKRRLAEAQAEISADKRRRGK